MAYLARSERRTTILEAAISIAMKEGLTAATVRRVAQETGTAFGQIHHHFRSVAEMRAEVFATLSRRSLEERSRKHAGDAPNDRLLALLGYFDTDRDIQENRLWNEAMLVAEQDGLMKAAFAESIRVWQLEIKAVIETGQSAGMFAGSASPEDSAWRLIGLSNGLYGLMPYETLGFSKETFNRHIRTAIEHELRG